MDSVLFDSLREFVKPYYADKGELEGLEHVQRLLADAKALAGDEKYDEDLLIFGAYFHGLIFTAESEIRDFLFSLGLDRALVIRIMKVAWESGKEADPETTEGGLLHDAHLIEGGKEFQVAKWLIGAASSGQTLPPALDFLSNRPVGKYRCCTPAGRKIHAEIEAYRGDFVEAVNAALAGRSAVGGAPAGKKAMKNPVPVQPLPTLKTGTSPEKDS